MLTSFVFIIVAFFLQGGRPEGRPLKPPIKLVLGAGVTGRPLFSDLLDDLGQVVAFRVLQRREGPVGFKLLQPKDLA